MAQREPKTQNVGGSFHLCSAPNTVTLSKSFDLQLSTSSHQEEMPGEERAGGFQSLPGEDGTQLCLLGGGEILQLPVEFCPRK